MILYGIPELLSGCATLWLAFFVRFELPPNRVRIHFFGWLIALSVWNFGSFSTFAVFDVRAAVWAARAAHFGAIFIPFTFLRFVAAFTGQARKQKPWITFSGWVTGLLALLDLSPCIIRNATKLSYNYYGHPGSLYFLFVLNFFVTVVVCLVWLWGFMREQTGEKKAQARLLFLASLIGYVAGAVDFFPVFGIDVCPVGNPTNIVFVSIIAYAIIRHQLFGIEVIVKKTLVFAGLSFFAIALVSVPLLVLPRLWGASMTGGFQVWILVLTGVAVAALVEPVHQLLVNVTDRFLFQKRTQIRVVLNRLSERVRSIIEGAPIGETVLSTLHEAFRLESGMYFIRDEAAGSLKLSGYFGYAPENFEKCLKEYSKSPGPAGYFSQNENLILALDHFDAAKLPDPVKCWLEAAKARVVIPLVIDRDRKGLLVLGKKKSDDEFYRQELAFFPTLQSQVALAIRSALFFEAALREREGKLKAEDTARRVHYAETLGHEMKNKLAMGVLCAKNLMERVVPRFKHIHEKYLDGKVSDDLSRAVKTLYEQVSRSAEELKDHLDVIKIITKTAQSHLSSNQEIFEEIYVKMVWEDAVKEFDVRNTDVQFLGPPGRNFFVWGNPVRLKQVFENLIANSLEAMEGREGKTITLECSLRERQGLKVGYFVYADNGPGIPPEIHDRIFEKYFSTKNKPRREGDPDSGSGYGLYLCRDILENLHRGGFELDRDYAGGARFVFWIPTGGPESG